MLARADPDTAITFPKITKLILKAEGIVFCL